MSNSSPNPPCGPCQRDGGYRITPGGPIYPPTEAVPPCTGRQFMTNDEGARTGEVWEYEATCATHYHDIVERQYAQRNRLREIEHARRSKR